MEREGLQISSLCLVRWRSDSKNFQLLLQYPIFKSKRKSNPSLPISPKSKWSRMQVWRTLMESIPIKNWTLMNFENRVYILLFKKWAEKWPENAALCFNLWYLRRNKWITSFVVTNNPSSQRRSPSQLLHLHYYSTSFSSN